MNIVWYRVPKAAGSSIQIALENIGKYVVLERPRPDCVFAIRPEFNWREEAARDWDFYRSAWKFAVVRNPWDRFVSACAFVEKRGHMVGKTWRDMAFHPNQVQNSHPELHITRSQTRILTDEQGRLLVDEVLRFENLPTGWSKADDWSKVEERLGVRCPLGHHNTSLHPPYWEVFGDDQEWIEQVGKMFQDDIERFGYAYEDYRALREEEA